MRQENMTQIETLILPILNDLGYELVDLQLQQDGKQIKPNKTWWWLTALVIITVSFT